MIAALVPTRRVVDGRLSSYSLGVRNRKVAGGSKYCTTQYSDSTVSRMNTIKYQHRKSRKNSVQAKMGVDGEDVVSRSP